MIISTRELKGAKKADNKTILGKERDLETNSVIEPVASDGLKRKLYP